MVCLAVVVIVAQFKSQTTTGLFPLKPAVVVGLALSLCPLGILIATPAGSPVWFTLQSVQCVTVYTRQLVHQNLL